MERNRPCFGIDLGTSNTEISMLYNGESKTLRIPQSRSWDGHQTARAKRLPSLVYFAEDGSCRYGEVFRQPKYEMGSRFGRVAMNTKRMLLENPEAPAWSFPQNGIEVEYSPKDIAEKLLSQCVAVAKEAGYEEGDPVMITVPCAYQMDQIQATLRAARDAGFYIQSNVELITEPVAALIEYICCQNPKQEESKQLDTSQPFNILVYDIGGGTLDLALVRVEKIVDGFRFTELSNNDFRISDTIGGADFDERAMERIVEYQLKLEAGKRNCSVIEMERMIEERFPAGMNGLRELTIGHTFQMKEQLMRGPVYLDPLVLNDEDYDDMDMTPICVSLRGDTGHPNELGYLDFVQEFLTPGTPRNILDCIRTVLESAMYNGAPVKVGDVKKMLITGGMCNFPPVQEALESYLKWEKSHSSAPINLDIIRSTAGLEAVSIGAAYSHGLKIENSRSYRPMHYFLDVSEGLPFDLTSPSHKEISLRSPRDMLLNIYCGTNQADPNMRRQYSYPHLFQPPLELPAKIFFRFQVDPSGEGTLTGIIRAPGKPDLKIQFREAWAMETRNSTAKRNSGILQGPLAEMLRSKTSSNYTKQSAKVFQGGKSVHPEPGKEKRLFQDCGDYKRASMVLAKCLQIFDRSGHVGDTISTCFNRLLNLIEKHYQNPDNLSIPALQYALYAMRQLPLDQVTMPSFPPRWDDNTSSSNRLLEDIAAGISDLCNCVKSLISTGNEHLQIALEKEIYYCIREWGWQDIFQVLLSMAQCLGNYQMAASLQSRLQYRKMRMDQGQPEAMGMPALNTPNRLAQVYLNHLDQGNEPTPEFCSFVKAFFKDPFDYGDSNWVRCRTVMRLLPKLPEDVRSHVCQSDRRLENLLNSLDLSSVESPDDLKEPLYRGPQDRASFNKVWIHVYHFLDNPSTRWHMMKILSERGRYYDKNLTQRVLSFPVPEEPEHRRSLIRVLGFCRSDDAKQKLQTMWNHCTLNLKMSMVTDQLSPQKNVIAYIDKAEQCFADDSFVAGILNDESIDLLVSMCLYKDGRNARRLVLVSALLSSIPHEWLIGTAKQRRVMKRLLDAVHNLWNSTLERSKAEKSEMDAYGPKLTMGLDQLAFLSIRHTKRHNQLNRALRNYCSLFMEGIHLKKLYQPDLVYPLQRLFDAFDYCPLSPHSQKDFIRFLNVHYRSEDIRSRSEEYRQLLIRWCHITSGSQRKTLVDSIAFTELVGKVPETNDI